MRNATLRQVRPALTAATTTAAIVALAHAARNSVALPRLPRDTVTSRRVAILVPARDEVADIAACVRTLRAQRGVGSAEVVVLDDGSSDDTAAVAATSGARVVQGATLPPGWLGKPWACAQLADAVPDAEVLVFVDADTRLSPDGVAGAVALLDAAGFDFVSPYPRQVAVGPAERLTQPLLVWLWLTLLPLSRSYRSVRPSLVAANGQFLVVRREMYERAGGFAAVRSAVLDDVAFARALRRVGGTGGFVAGRDVASCRMYRGVGAVRAGYGKSLSVAVGGSRTASIGAAAAATAVWVWPALAMLGWRSRLGAIGYLAGVASRLLAARAGGSRVFPDAFMHPVSVAVAAALTVDSAIRRHRVTWRGRSVRL